MQVASLTAISAIISAVRAKSDVVYALAQNAIFLTRTTCFFPIAL